jgi:hypothetical protein
MKKTQPRDKKSPARKKKQSLKRTSKPTVPMRLFQVYYRIHPTFELDKNLTKRSVLNQITHRFVVTLHAKDLDDAYTKMQGEKWSPNGVAFQLISQIGVGHTSMSIGDCLYEPYMGEMYQCDIVGWEQVTK